MSYLKIFTTDYTDYTDKHRLELVEKDGMYIE